MDNKELLIELLNEVDEVKRYVANIHVNTDNEVKEIHELVKRMDRQIQENDRQIDRIERFEKTLNELRSSMRQIEKKV